MARLRWTTLVCAVMLSGSLPSNGKRFAGPGVMLWAWDRAEDLRFLTPENAGVAFLAATATIRPDGSVRFQPRRHSLSLPKGISTIAVVRIETPAKHASVHQDELLRGLVYVANQPGIAGLQIDFDARSSEREFYSGLLARLRRTTGHAAGITALASWCDGDPWLNQAPVAEAVPMFFRMGRGERREMEVRSPVCQTSIGLSLDEAFPNRRPRGLRSDSRVYLFNPHSWTSADYSAALVKLARWR